MGRHFLRRGRSGQIIWTFDAKQDFQTVNGVMPVAARLDPPEQWFNGMLYVASGYVGIRAARKATWCWRSVGQNKSARWGAPGPPAAAEWEFRFRLWKQAGRPLWTSMRWPPRLLPPASHRVIKAVNPRLSARLMSAPFAKDVRQRYSSPRTQLREGELVAGGRRPCSTPRRAPAANPAKRWRALVRPPS